jgi:hypothetical protein
MRTHWLSGRDAPSAGEPGHRVVAHGLGREGECREEHSSDLVGDAHQMACRGGRTRSPKAGEVLVKLAASGRCHSDEHLITGDMVLDPAMAEAMNAKPAAW